MTTLGCGLVGCGTVGSGVVRLWAGPEGPAVALAAVAVRNVHKPREVDLNGLRLTDDAGAVARDPAIGLVIEATGDLSLARELAVESLDRKKSFVTASKTLVAEFGPELEELAEARGVAFRYEAAVGGAVPVVALLRLGLSPGPIRGFEGILNGTCNFILGRLEEGLPFAEALRIARERGFAEPDSGRDTSGRDSAEKLIVLARLCGVRLSRESLPTSGIEDLRPEDAAFARRRGFALRLVATFRDRGDRVTAGVAPAFVPRDSLLAQAKDEENVVLLDGGPAGRIALLGRGAGSLPTASAILADVRESLRGLSPTASRPARRAVVEEDDAPQRHYVALQRCGRAAADLMDALSGAGVGVEAIASECPGRVQALTSPAPSAVVRRALASVPARERVHAVVCESYPPVSTGNAGSELHSLQEPA